MTQTAGVGRPRSNPKPTALAPYEEILDAAAELFTTRGYAATTTREIADAVGFRQGSLFHHFSRKEDILAELLDRTLEPATTFLQHLVTATEAPDLKLFTLVRRDVLNLCSGSCNLGKLQLMPEARLDRFDDFWAKRARLWDGYRRLVQAAVLDGRLSDQDPRLATHLIFGLVESVIIWFERTGDMSADLVATEVATAGLRALGSTGRRLNTLVSKSDALLASLS